MRTKIKCVEGIVLSEVNYSESSKILNILTREYGLIGVLSRGCRNIKSKLRSVSRNLIYASFHIYYKEEGLSTLISVDLLSSYNHIIMDLNKITYATYILELVKQVSMQSDEEEIFSILKASLQKIDEGFDEAILTNIVELKCLNYLGIRPSIDCCALCGGHTDILTLSSDVGGLLCKNCRTNEFLVKEITLTLIRMFYYVDIDKITKLSIKSENVLEVNRFLQEYYEKYTGIYLKSKKMLEKVTKLVES